MKFQKVLAVILSLAFATIAWRAQATVIDFGGLPGPNGTAYTGHVEDGFTVTPNDGDWHQGLVYGAPTPSIFGGPVPQPVFGSITVTGGIFRFISVDLSSNSATGTRATVIGYMNGITQFGYDFTITTANQFVTLVNPGPFMVDIDELYIAMMPDTGVSSYNIDNIVLRSVRAVPAPAALGLIILGLAGVGFTRRRLA
ncbi:hypothetical protein [Aestuariispira ectoiniformans]|uniref:hypothetical protein n=1 Tax=Aestuariispira ectoiniformans TaxID=2775080 RepID=UPI00223B6CB8|nr:hypothetical protein [Aestuariispira ectoiniformans]